MRIPLLLFCVLFMTTGLTAQTPTVVPEFVPVQTDLFSAPRNYTNALADFDSDGDPDLFVGFAHGIPNRLYRNDNGVFTEIAVSAGVADTEQTRGAAWGDFNGDGLPDLFIAFTPPSTEPCKLYRNDGSGKFSDVAESMGVNVAGNFRQISWIDFDMDGDSDLFIGVRNGPNLLFRNEGVKFENVSRAMSIDDPRRTVGAVWFDFDLDGDPDLYTNNQNGDRNGLHRNDGTHFLDVAPDLGLDSGGRPLQYSFGSIRPSLADYDNDGDFDIFNANYGPNSLYRNDGGGRFINVGEEAGLAIDSRYDAGEWADINHDGLLDLYVNGTVSRTTNYRDYLFINEGGIFRDITSPDILNLQADHGIQWVDFDLDGDLDLSLTGAAQDGMHFVLKNRLDSKIAEQSLKVLVLNEKGAYISAGYEVRLYDSATGTLLGSRIFDTGSGYNSQNILPVHFGLTKMSPVDVEIAQPTINGRRTSFIREVNPADFRGRFLTIKTDNSGNIISNH